MGDKYLTLDDFLKGRAWPKTKASLNHLINKHRTEMIDKGILTKFDGLLFIDPVKFDAWVWSENCAEILGDEK